MCGVFGQLSGFFTAAPMVPGSPRDLLGHAAIPRCGRDKGRLNVVVGWLCDDFVSIADGKHHTVSKPKTKKMKHLHFTGFYIAELRSKLVSGECVTDKMIAESISAADGLSFRSCKNAFPQLPKCVPAIAGNGRGTDVLMDADMTIICRDGVKYG